MDDGVARRPLVRAAHVIKRLASIVVCLALTCAGCVTRTSLPVPAAERPASWAEPMTVAGVPNLYRITPLLYRSGQPTAAGFRNLQKLGIRTVINLRAFNDDEAETRGTAFATTDRIGPV